MKDNFNACLKILLEFEGGFVNHPDDPGGMTNLGVTKNTYEKFLGKSVSEETMKSLTKNDVAPIYREKYWNKIKGDELPKGVDLVTFDYAVHSGPFRAAQYLQVVCNAEIDGIIGPNTLSKVEESEKEKLIDRYIETRRVFLKSLPNYESFKRGWLRRLAELRHKAIAMLD